MPKKTVTKAVILAAGYGTRFLPWTKASPKEMLPVVDKPVIQYVVEDAVAAGVKDVVIVSSASKRPIEDHFDYSFELEYMLEKAGKTKELDEARAIAELATFIYVRQKGRKGNLAAFKCGYEAVGDEPFFGLFGDDIFGADPTRCQQLLEVFKQYRAPVLGCIETHDPSDAKKYGYVDGDEVRPGLMKIGKIIEKPGIGKTPSNLVTIGGGIFGPEVMRYYDQCAKETEGEVVYSEAIQKYIDDGGDFYALKINGHHYDCGNKVSYVKAIIALALERGDIEPELRRYIRELK